ncbi:ribonucleotide reductase of class Ia (aerobic) alpha subunit [Salmonella phage vB_Sen_I1]|uniref:Ribonucleotide reductase of class Ia (Aerobic) alpha subunit n=1 Tax=Salmonella phage vB_Sen_I1 TaxID=2723910 RepID=A0A7L5CBA5_9CAUD|nr:ribonucleotide reductase of class Ia (aerobic) alpha subunit [Salmonella phage vB_Sen_I1]
MDKTLWQNHHEFAEYWPLLSGQCVDNMAVFRNAGMPHFAPDQQLIGFQDDTRFPLWLRPF